LARGVALLLVAGTPLVVVAEVSETALLMPFNVESIAVSEALNDMTHAI